MKRTTYLLVAVGLAVAMRSAQATTVIPPTFDQLVTQAEIIFQGSVTDVRSQWVGEGADRHIVSYISFKVEDSLKGNPGESYTIRMFGGTVGDQSMAISDAPRFTVGDRDILFVENNGSQVVPLVGIMCGRFHVQRNESGLDIVKDDVGEPVKNVGRLGRTANAIAANATEPDMTAAEFKAAVRSKLQSAQ